MGLLRIVDGIPDGLLQATPRDLLACLGGPTLFHLPGKRQPALFVSVLMHGNEITGFEVVRALLRQWQDKMPSLPRAMSVFIGNVSAAEQGMRHLPGQPDYNRVWPGGIAQDSEEAAMMREVVAHMRERGIFASVDIHNNTGLNPHYACVNRLDQRFFHMASLFSRTVIYFIRPQGVQSMAFAELGPAVTLECGQPGQHYGVDHALEYLQACLHLSAIPEHPLAEQDIDLFHPVAIAKVDPQTRLNGDDSADDLLFPEDLDHLNFTELPVGTILATVGNPQTPPLQVTNDAGELVTERYLKLVDGQWRTRVPLMPSMLTLDRTVIRQDCFCYLLERRRFG